MLALHDGCKGRLGTEGGLALAGGLQLLVCLHKVCEASHRFRSLTEAELRFRLEDAATRN